LNKNNWVHYFGLVMQLGLVISACILVGLLIGVFLDKIFKTNGIFLVVFLIFGIVAGFKSAYQDIMRSSK